MTGPNVRVDIPRDPDAGPLDPFRGHLQRDAESTELSLGNDRVGAVVSDRDRATRVRPFGDEGIAGYEHIE